MNYIELVEQTITHLEKNLEYELKVDDVSKEFFFSKYHFYRIFKALTGYSITDYLNKRRMSRSIKMLLESHLTILEIAMRCGINSHEVFTRKFKREFGVTPSQFRQHKMEVELFNKIDVVKRDFINRKQEIIVSYELVEIQEIKTKGFISNSYHHQIDFNTAYFTVYEHAVRWFEESDHKGELYAMTLSEKNESGLMDIFIGFDNMKDTEENVANNYVEYTIPASKYAKFTYNGLYVNISSTVINDIYKCISLEGLQIKDTDIQIIEKYKESYYDTREFVIMVPIE